MSSERGLSALIYANPNQGVLPLALTAPYPRLVLDVEKKMRLRTEHTRRWWNPREDAPPVADGTWDTCVVSVLEYEDVTAAFEYLKTGQHQFQSVILDSISELQDKAKYSIAGEKQFQTPDWGELLRKMNFFCKGLRDLVEHPVNPVQAVVITATNTEVKGINRPFLQGSIKDQVPFWFDMVGYLYTDQAVNEANQTYTEHYLLTGVNPEYVTGTAINNLPEIIAAPNIEEILDMAFPATAVAPAAPVPDAAPAPLTHDAPENQEN